MKEGTAKTIFVATYLVIEEKSDREKGVVINHGQTTKLEEE